MEKIDHPQWLGVLSSTTAHAQRGGKAAAGRSKRNVWVVVGFFGLMVASLINSLI